MITISDTIVLPEYDIIDKVTSLLVQDISDTETFDIENIVVTSDLSVITSTDTLAQISP